MLDTNISEPALNDAEGLTPSKQTQNEMLVLMAPIGQLVEFKFKNSRNKMSKAGLEELAISLKKRWINPITVRKSTDETTYEVIAGNRRWEAAKMAAFEYVPVNIVALDDKDAYELHMRENYDREDISLVDEAKAAQRFVSLYEGDYKLAAQALKWEVKTVKDRLNLLRCSELVLEALSEGKIELGHAIVLSSFTEKLQGGTLKKIIDEKWSIKYLKERAGKAKKRIALAKFDTTDCQQCPHNTIAQSDMFSVGVESDAQCANLSCWKGKTEEWLAVQRTDAEERFGKVLLWVESGEADRNTVAATVVGETQYSQSCVNCESNVVIMDDRDRKEGELVKSQCIDKVCFAKCVKAHERKSKPPTSKKAPNESTSSNSNTEKANEVANKKKAIVAAKPTAKVIDRERETLASACLNHIQDKTVLLNSLVLSLVSELTGYKGVCSGPLMFDGKVQALQKLSADELQNHTQKALLEFLENHCVNNSDFGTKTAAKILVSVLETMDEKRNVAIGAWNADKETLINYRVDGIVELCRLSGFIDAFDKDTKNIESKLTFEKISKRTKAKFIEAITDFYFDWSAFAPESYLSQLK